MAHAIDPVSQASHSEPAYRRFRDEPRVRFEARVRQTTGLQLVFGGMVTLLGLLIPAVLIGGASVVARSGVAMSGVVFALALGLIGTVVGGSILIMGFIKFAREVWKD